MPIDIRRITKALVLCFAVLLLTLIPAGAQGAVDDSYRGYGYVKTANGSVWAPAYRWYTDYGWWNAWRRNGEYVWIQPFGTGWSWTWSSGAGWLAMKGSDLSTQYSGTTGLQGTVKVGGTVRGGVELTFLERQGSWYGDSYSAVTDSTGKYRITLPTGNYFVSSDVNYLWGGASVAVPSSGFATANFTIPA